MKPSTEIARKTVRSSARGFTLLELLVSVLIVGLLAGLIFPAVISAREKASSARCATVARTLGAATQLYAAENDNNLPLVVGPESGGIANSWTHQIQPYVSNSAMGGTKEGTGDARTNRYFRCFSDRVKRNVGNRTICSYGLNRLVHKNGIVTNLDHKKITTITEPSRTILYGDVWLADNTVADANSLGPNGSFIADYHGRGANYCFADGHVEFLSKETVFANDKILLKIP